MAENTKIEWADHTFNPWMGCTRVSPACDNCYAAEMMDARYGRVKWGSGEPRVRTASANWRKPIKWDNEAQRTGKRPFVFCASLADVFDNEVDDTWRYDLFELIQTTQHVTWLLLTKRIGNVIDMMSKFPSPRSPANFAIGMTVCNQAEYDRDRMKMDQVRRVVQPAFTFGSFEPLLGPIILDNNAPDWIIVGGESGKSARPMNLDWARSLRAQSAELGRVFNFKQVGGRKADKGGHTLDGKVYLDRPKIAA